MDNFDGFSIHYIVAVFSNSWVVCVPFFEVNVNVIITHCLLFGGGGGCSLFPFWKNKLFWFDHDFGYIA